MAGLVKHLLERNEALSLVVSSLNLSKYGVPKVSTTLNNALGTLLYDDVVALSPYPPYSRSTRDGYAVLSSDTWGASPTAPVFLSSVGEVEMGALSNLSLKPGECALIHTGGMLPEGADSIVMLEDTASAGNLIEVRRAVQSGDNLILKGEDYAPPQVLLHKGTLIDTRSIGILASSGITRFDTAAIKVGIISSGDEIVEADAPSLPLGKIRDVNTWLVSSILQERGYGVTSFGIASDNQDILKEKLERARQECQVILLSGGSSVSERDHTPALLEALPHPGLIVRGLNLAPGKPTLIAGIEESEQLVIGLPGHPLSCLVVVWSVVLPLLSAITTGRISEPWRSLRIEAGADIMGRAGIEEFIPCRIEKGMVFPLAAKSSYVSILRQSDGFIHLSPQEETLRKGESAEVCLW